MLGNLKKTILFFGDLLVMYMSLYLTLLLRYREIPAQNIWEMHFLPFTVLFLVWCAVYYINGLYDIAATKNDVEFYNSVLRNLLVSFAMAAAYFYLLTDNLFHIKPQLVFFIMIGVHSIQFSLWRFWYNAFVQRPEFLKNILVIGMKDEARELVDEIFKKPQLGYRIAAIINGQNMASEFPGVAIYDATADIKKIIRDHGISTVITAVDPRTIPELVQNLFSSLSMRIQFYDLPDFYEKLTVKIPVTGIGHIWFLQNIAKGQNGIYEFLKRSTDLLLATVGLIVSLPFWPIIAVAIKLDSSGQIFFKQNRVGFLGRHFTAVKFRSMRVGAEAEGGPQWASKNDPRVTRLGRFMRKVRLDEIPQFINIIKGEMSLIGPRPERPEFVKTLERDIPFYNERHLVKPGLTGWAQINFQYGESTRDAFKKLQYDLFYVKNRSIPLDLGIVLKTINIMLSGKGQ